MAARRGVERATWSLEIPGSGAGEGVRFSTFMTRCRRAQRGNFGREKRDAGQEECASKRDTMSPASKVMVRGRRRWQTKALLEVVLARRNEVRLAISPAPSRQSDQPRSSRRSRQVRTIPDNHGGRFSLHRPVEPSLGPSGELLPIYLIVQTTHCPDPPRLLPRADLPPLRMTQAPPA